MNPHISLETTLVCFVFFLIISNMFIILRVLAPWIIPPKKHPWGSVHKQYMP